VIQRFTYLGSVTIEHVKDGDLEEWNVYPLAPEEPPSAPELFMEEPQPTLLAAPLELGVAAPARIAPAASSGFKAGLASFGGMLAAGLLYVQENFGSVTDISLKNVVLIAAGAVISGLLYFFYRWYKPHTP